MRALLRTGMVTAITLVCSVVVGVGGAVWWLHETPASVRNLALYLTVSGGLALVLGSAAVLLGIRYLPRLSLKIGLGYVAGTVAAILTVLYTPLLMFKEQSDLDLLVLLLLSFLIVSLGLAWVVGMGAAADVRVLAAASRRIAAGDFDTQVHLYTSDELADLATDLTSMSSQLGAAFARERSAEQGRRDLIAAISHDLRTPLASIRAMLEAIADGVVEDADTIHRYHGLMRTEVGRLSHLIDDLFELSRLDAGQMSFTPVPFSLTELLADTLAGLTPRAGAHGVRLNLPPNTPPIPVCADPGGIQRVVVNIVDNGIRHSPPGGQVTVEVTARAEEVVVAVGDTGEGIDAQDAPHLFDRFFRGDRARTPDAGGAGLGLAIARSIVEAHGGRIWAENAPGGGATFLFTLPGMQAEQAERRINVPTGA